MKLTLGQLVSTPGALDALSEANQSALDFIMRHADGDWGEVPPEDAKANDDALKHGDRIISAYTLSTGVKIWIITEADRSATTILLPDEY